MYVQKENLKSLAKRKLGRLIAVCRQNSIYIPGNNPYQTINNAWGRIKNYSHESTKDDLEAKIKWLEGLIERALQGDRTISSELR
jgi:hypothetical protein